MNSFFFEARNETLKIFRDEALKSFRDEALSISETNADTHFRLTPASELAFYTPQEVAEATIDGILKNKKYVVLPPFLTSVLNLLRYE